MLRVPPLNPPKCFVVGFFDLMGINRELCELANCSVIGQEEIDNLGRQARKVLHFRDDFEKFEEGEHRVSQRFDESRSNEERELMARYQGNPVKLFIFIFADTVVAYSSLDTSERQVPLDSCSNILIKAAASQLFSLVRKTPVRGGIEIGLGIEINDQEIFGVGISEAYRLEKKKADWPRIIVGKRLKKYIVDIMNGRCNCDSDRLNQQHAKLCFDLLYFDHEGVAMVDLLSPILSAVVGDDYPELLSKARTFVATELDRFTTQGDGQLVDRYNKLATYLSNER